MKSVLIWLLIVTILKGLVWMSVVPMWHTPDEQAHFAQVQNVAEGISPVYGNPTTSQEIYTSEILLQTARDGMGNNSYTYHPEFNIPYTSATEGVYENEIKQIPKLDRTKMVITEATAYPPLYYRLASLGYKSAYSNDLITRVFITRLISILLLVITVFFTYKIGTLIFPKNPILSVTAAILVSFQPMFSFTMAGINSDVLMNALFTAFIYYTLIFALEPFKVQTILLMGLVYLAGVLTKPTFHIGFLLVLAAAFVFIKNHFKQLLTLKKYIFSIALLFTLVVIASLFAMRVRIAETINTGSFTLIPEVSFENQAKPDLTLVTHLKWTAQHTIREVLPWYWGVFKWLGVTLPRWSNRLVNRILIIAMIGLVIYAVKRIKDKHLGKSDVGDLLLMFAAVSYFTTLTVWDWLFTRSNGYSFGIQGRYLFPHISAHMLLLLVGLLQFISQKRQALRYFLTLMVVGGMVGLNFVALQTIVQVYYPNVHLLTLVLQVSQYKPWFLKGSFLIAIWSAYLISLTVFLWQLVKLGKNQQSLYQS